MPLLKGLSRRPLIISCASALLTFLLVRFLLSSSPHLKGSTADSRKGRQRTHTHSSAAVGSAGLPGKVASGKLSLQQSKPFATVAAPSPAPLFSASSPAAGVDPWQSFCSPAVQALAPAQRKVELQKQADLLLQRTQQTLLSLQPRPHYVSAYRAAERDYWMPQLPAWMLQHSCEVLQEEKKERGQGGLQKREEEGSAAAAVGEVWDGEGKPPSFPLHHLDVGAAYGTLAAFFYLSSANASQAHCIDFYQRYLSPVAEQELQMELVMMNVEVEQLPQEWGGGRGAGLDAQQQQAQAGDAKAQAEAEAGKAVPPLMHTIILTDTLEAFNFNALPTLQKLHKVLQPGGRFFLSTAMGFRPKPEPPAATEPSQQGEGAGKTKEEQEEEARAFAAAAARAGWRGRPMPAQLPPGTFAQPVGYKDDIHYRMAPWELAEALQEAGFAVECMEANQKGDHLLASAVKLPLPEGAAASASSEGGALRGALQQEQHQPLCLRQPDFCSCVHL